MTIKANFPAIKPSLNLDFANSKVLDPRITFSRSSTATYYDGKTVSKAEENLLTYSQEFDKAAWLKTNAAVTVNVVVAPDGTTTADKLVETAVSGFHGCRQVVGGTVGTTYTYSVYLKAAERGWALVWFDSDSAGAYFNLSDGTLGTVSAGVTATNGISVGNGWYRCTITRTITGGATVQVYAASGNNGVSYTGDGTSGIYIWGAQLEQRSTATAYTPTTSAPITNYIPVLQTAAANVARFDHNPVTGESKGLLIEEQRTNLFVRSSDFTSGTWAKSAGLSVTPNAVAAPDGTISGTAVSISQAAQMTQNATATGTAAAFSIYAKAGAYTSLPLGIRNGTTSTNIAVATLYFSTGTIASSTGTSSLSYVGNGWYRATLIASAGISVGDTLVVYAAQGSVAADNAFYLWGAQLETGAFPTSYIPTTTAQVTRSADSASMTGSNFSSWYRADEGTLYANTIHNGIESSMRAAAITDGTTNNYMSFDSVNATIPRFRVRYGNADQALITGSASTGEFKGSVTYKTNDCQAAYNGTTTSNDASVAIPTVNQLVIGAGGAGGVVVCNTTIKRIAYYPKRLSNAELQALTA